MRILMLVAAAALSYHPTLPQFSPPGEKAIELGCPLTPSAFAKVKKALAWKPGKERADYYFDGYANGRYLMKKQAVKLKVRVKVSDKGPHWQISRFVGKDDVVVDGLAIKIHTTESWEGKLKGSAGKAFLASADRFFDREKAGGAPMRQAADQVDAAWRQLRAEKDLPGLPALDFYLKGQPYKFYPVKRTSPKQRLTATLPGLKLMLGTEPERDANGKPFLAHELEVEPTSGEFTLADARKAAVEVGHLLKKAGVTPAEQVEVSADGYLYTLKQISR